MLGQRGLSMTRDWHFDSLGLSCFRESLLEPAPELPELCPCPWSADGVGYHDDPPKAFPFAPCLRPPGASQKEFSGPPVAKNDRGGTLIAHEAFRCIVCLRHFAQGHIRPLVCHRLDCLDRRGRLGRLGIGLKHVHYRCVILA